jgi:hypothetical protein
MFRVLENIGQGAELRNSVTAQKLSFRVLHYHQTPICLCVSLDSFLCHYEAVNDIPLLLSP